jgi:hypothetical protein
MSNEKNRATVASEQGKIQSIPGYSYPFRATIKDRCGKRKDRIEITFLDDPPLEALEAISANGFRYANDIGVWRSCSNSISRQIAEDVVRRGLISKSTLSEAIIPSKLANGKLYKAENLVLASSRIYPCSATYSKPFREAIQKAIHIIEEVHYLDADCESIPVRLVKDCDGYAAQFWPDQLEIRVCKTQSPRVLTIVHEIGHYLDFSLAECINDWRKELMVTIKRTKGYKALKNFDGESMGKAIVSDGNKTKEKYYRLRELDPGRKYRIEACDDVELFARAYEQYIGIKSDQLQSELEPETEHRLEIIGWGNFDPVWNARPILWKMDDFQEIVPLFDKMFSDIGWKIPAK